MTYIILYYNVGLVIDKLSFLNSQNQDTLSKLDNKGQRI